MRCKETYATQSLRVFPKDLNIYHTLFGGKILEQVDATCSISVSRFCHQKAFTISVDHMEFKHPALLDQVMTITSFVSGVGTRSIETFARITGEDLQTGETFEMGSCFMTYALAKEVETTLPTLTPETELEKRICTGYATRRSLSEEYRAHVKVLEL